MSISLISTPPRFSSANNQIIYHISSTNTAQPNFNFVIDVFVIDAPINPVIRLTYPVQPSSTELTFDISDVIKNYVSYDLLNVTGSVIAPNTNSRAKYYCQFRELYDIAGVPTLSSVLASDPTTPSTSNYKWGINSIYDFEDFTVSGFINDYSGKFLQSKIKNYIIVPDEYKVLTYFDPNRVVTGLQFSSLDASTALEVQFGSRIVGDGGAIEAVSCLISFLSSIGADSFSVSVSETANEYLFNINDSTYTLDYYSLSINSDFYTVSLLSGSTVLDSYTQYVDNTCSKYDTIRLHYMAKNGAFESFNFRYIHRKNESIERSQYKKYLNIGYSKSDRLQTNYQTTIQDTYTLNSDWISDEQAELFEQMLTSPVLYWEKSDSVFIAVNVTNTSYETKKYINDKSLFNLTIDIEPTYKRYRQQL